MKPTRLNRFQTFAVCSVLTTLTACTPADKVPLSGRITMEYAGVSQSGDDVMFTLENGTAQAIYFRGTPDPALGKLYMSCDLIKETVVYSQRVFEPALKDKIIEVKSGERLQLNLLASLPPDFRNHKGRCQLSLALEGGTVVESREFVP
jgi:hypothetical protein